MTYHIGVVAFRKLSKALRFCWSFLEYTWKLKAELKSKYYNYPQTNNSHWSFGKRLFSSFTDERHWSESIIITWAICTQTGTNTVPVWVQITQVKLKASESSQKHKHGAMRCFCLTRQNVWSFFGVLSPRHPIKRFCGKIRTKSLRLWPYGRSHWVVFGVSKIVFNMMVDW